MLEDLIIMVMRRLPIKRAFATKWNSDIALRIVKVLEENKEESFNQSLEFNGEVGYETKKKETKVLLIQTTGHAHAGHAN